MRWYVSAVLGVLGALLLSLPAAAGGPCEQIAIRVEAAGERVAAPDACKADLLELLERLPDTATEAPTTQDGLPIGIVLAVVVGVLTFAYVFTRPSRITGRKD